MSHHPHPHPLPQVGEPIEDLVEAVIEILGDPNFSDDEIELKIEALASEPILTRRLIDVVPEAFGLILISHIENADKMELPTTFSAKNINGDWKNFSFKEEPIFIAGVLAQSTELKPVTPCKRQKDEV